MSERLPPSHELRRLRRLAAIQRYLLDALKGEDPVGLVLQRLAGTLRLGAGLVGPAGVVRAAAGALPTDLAGVPVPAQGRVQAHSLGGWSLAVGALPPQRGEPLELLVLASRTAVVERELVCGAVHSATAILAAARQAGWAARRQRRAVDAHLVAALIDELEVQVQSSPDELALRLAAAGVELGAGVQMLVVVLAGPGVGVSPGVGEVALAEAVEVLETTFALDSAGALVGVPHAREVVALVPSLSAELRAKLEQTLGAQLRLGIGRCAYSIAQARASCADARAAALAIADDPDARSCACDELELAALVVAQLDRDALDPHLRPLLGTLDSQPGMRSALLAYYEHRFDAAAAARALHLHPNTLRYRLERLATLLGRSLRDPALVTSVQLALAHERRAPAHAGRK
ncbi:MAG TPA: helix-turn-helix domain-containing protein [Solirubrobacteraceae bacterium]|jgi:purine catabolism regulator